MNNTNMSSSFGNLGIAPKLLEILDKQKFTTPTPIQQQSIPQAITGKDLIGIAQTGTGKTLAFGIPMIQRLAQSGGKGLGLVILPTRELALQVNDSLKKIGGTLGLKTAILIGGEPMGKQIRALGTRPHIIIATPGRLIDHIENKKVNLSNTSVLVLDEADRMLDMGFLPQIKKVLEALPRDKQTMLFSATMPEAIVSIANSYMSMPLRVEVAPAGSAVKSVTQEIFFVNRGEKNDLLKSILGQYKGSILVFSRTKHGARKIATSVREFGETATEIHSNKSLNQRLEALNGFKLGKYRVMVATDIAARGIDVAGIQLVVNYDLPDNAEDYVHRIGRTGRASMTGHAISFATHDQRRDVQTIERLIRKTLPVSKSPVASSGSKASDDAPRPRTASRPPSSARTNPSGSSSARYSRSNPHPDARTSSRPPSRPSGQRSAPSRYSSNRPTTTARSTSPNSSSRTDTDRKPYPKKGPKRIPFKRDFNDFKWGKF